jgi:hypothetical protein
VIQWEPCAGWMAFPHLTKCAGITRSFALGYRITDNSSDLWTQRFNRFKDNDVRALYGGADLLRGAVPDLVKELGLDVSKTAFVTALASGELTANKDRPLPKIARSCAEIVGAEFVLDALSKNIYGKIHNLYTEAQRDTELDKADYKSTNIGKTNILVFDDFITRGATQSKIAQAILSTNPKSRVYAVALCKAEKQAFCPNPQNDHIPAKWNDLWEKGEQRYLKQATGG